MAQCVVYVLKGLASRAPGLLARAEVTKNIIFFQWAQNLGTPPYRALLTPVDVIADDAAVCTSSARCFCA